MAQAGLPKLNLASKSISIKSSASSSLSGAQRSGISYGIMAQRSNNSIFSPKMAYSASTSALRHQLNSRVIINNNIPARAQKQDNGMSTMEKLMMISMMGNMAAQFGKGIADTIKELKGSKTDKGDVKIADSPTTDAPNPTTMNGKLKGAKSFKDIQNLEAEMNSKLDSFGSNYKQALEAAKNEINTTLSDANIQQALQDAGASVNLNSLPTGSDLSVTKDSDAAAFEKAEKSIDADIDKVSDFESKQLKPAVNKLSEKSGILEGNIKALDVQIGQLNEQLGALEDSLSRMAANDPNRATTETQIKDVKAKIEQKTKQKEKFEEQKANIDNAKKTLEKDIPDKLKSLTTELKNKKKALDDLKDTKADIADKKYDLVKENDEEITKNKKKMDTLAITIKSLKNGKADASDINKEIAKYNDCANTIIKLVASLEGAPADVKNAKGKSYKITNSQVDAKYTTIMEPELVDLNDKASKNIKENSAGTPRTTNPIGNAGGGNANRIWNNPYSRQSNDGGQVRPDGIHYDYNGIDIVKGVANDFFVAKNPNPNFQYPDQEIKGATLEEVKAKLDEINGNSSSQTFWKFES